MGMVQAEITLKNANDVTNVSRGILNEKEIRQTTVQALVDTGAATLVINEEMRQKLGLELKGTKPARLADNQPVLVTVAETVEVHWKNRSMTCQPWVIRNSREILLGAIPLEDMDLMVDPKKQELTGVHGEEELAIIY